MAATRALRTSLLFLECQLLPIGLHAVTEGHPQIGLLLRRHVFPSLLDVGERRVGDGVRLADLLLRGADCRRGPLDIDGLS